MTNPVRINGRMKWSVKNRVYTGFSIMGPFHNQFARGTPIRGRVSIRSVIIKAL